MARELACGVVDEGLKFQSVNPKLLGPAEVLDRNPSVDYSWQLRPIPVLLRETAFKHFQNIMLERTDPAFDELQHEFVVKHDFRDWLRRTGRPLPAFWYGMGAN